MHYLGLSSPDLTLEILRPGAWALSLGPSLALGLKARSQSDLDLPDRLIKVLFCRSLVKLEQLALASVPPGLPLPSRNEATAYR